MNIPMNVLAFAQDKVDVYKAFSDYFNHYRAENGNEKVKYDNSISFDEKNDKMHKALVNEVSRVSGVAFTEFKPEVYATNPMVNWAAFAVINAMIDTILPETLIDSIGIYTDIRVGGFGDNFSFEIKPRDLFAVTKAGRGKRISELHKQFDGQVTVTPVEHDITVAVSLYKVLSGKENLAEFVLKATRSIESELTLDAFTAFNTAMTALPTTPINGELKVAGFTQETAVRLAQSVTAFNLGAKAVFVGTQNALANILPSDANYRYQIDSDLVKLGYVRSAFGYDTMVLPQVADWKNPFKLLLDDTRIYVISPSSQKLVKTCIEGSTLAITSTPYQNANLTQTTTLKKNFASAVATNACAGLISLA
jgi:hypothetical protein